MKVLIGSTNKGKIDGATMAFQEYFADFDIDGVSVSSLVSEQPVNEEIYLGARNRVDNLIKYASDNNIKVDYYLGIESGITNLLGQWIIINVAVIKDAFGYESIGTSSGFPVPKKYVDEIINTSLGDVMDKMFHEHDLRSNIGGVSYLTNNVISRIDLTREAFVMALTQYINEFWNDKE